MFAINTSVAATQIVWDVNSFFFLFVAHLVLCYGHMLLYIPKYLFAITLYAKTKFFTKISIWQLTLFRYEIEKLYWLPIIFIYFFQTKSKQLDLFKIAKWQNTNDLPRQEKPWRKQNFYFCNSYFSFFSSCLDASFWLKHRIGKFGSKKIV